MANPLRLAEFVWFAEGEARLLRGRFGRSFEEAREWYDGYLFRNEKHVYNPLSVVRAMLDVSIFLICVICQKSRYPTKSPARKVRRSGRPPVL
jgi:hypothetical protein